MKGDKNMTKNKQECECYYKHVQPPKSSECACNPSGLPTSSGTECPYCEKPYKKVPQGEKCKKCNYTVYDGKTSWEIDKCLDCGNPTGENSGESVWFTPKQMEYIVDLLAKQKQKIRKKQREKADSIIYTIKRYTHDRSKSGYDDMRGACGNPCYQCKKDKRMLDEVLEILK